MDDECAVKAEYVFYDLIEKSLGIFNGGVLEKRSGSSIVSKKSGGEHVIDMTGRSGNLYASAKGSI